MSATASALPLSWGSEAEDLHPVPAYGEERMMILLHEQCHIRRKDHLVKFLAVLILSVYWFHPLVWIAFRCMSADMEMSCDEMVLERLGERRKGRLQQMPSGICCTEAYGAGDPGVR